MVGKKLFKYVTAGCVAAILIQVVPYGRSHANPAVVSEPRWNAAETRALAKRACFDCHSHETVWTWYSLIAPASWLVQFDVDEGRSELNFSDWKGGTRPAERPDKIAREISRGEMPPIQYRVAHPEARLSETEKQKLIEGLKASR